MGQASVDSQIRFTGIVHDLTVRLQDGDLAARAERARQGQREKSTRQSQSRCLSVSAGRRCIPAAATVNDYTAKNRPDKQKRGGLRKL